MEDTNEVSNTTNLGNEVLADVTNRDVFWFEDEGKEGWTFEIEAKNFSVPSVYSGIGVDAHILSYGIADGKIIRYSNLTEFNTPQGQEPFNRNLSAYRITQFIDNSTLAGTYTFVFTGRLNFSLTGSTTVNYTVTLIIKDFEPDLNFDLQYNSDELEPISENTFVLYKPILGNGLTDGKLPVSIIAELENYESPKRFLRQSGVTNLSIEDSVDSDDLRYLLEFNISYSGPVSNIQNITSKIVVELGQYIDADNEDDDLVSTFEIEEIEGSTRVVKEYKLYKSDDNDVKIDLTELLSYISEISASTIPGNHIYTIRIGAITRQLTIRVLEPVPLIKTDEESVKYGYFDGEEFISIDTVKYNSEDDKYYVNMSNIEQNDMYLLINIYPFGMTSSPPSYPYTFIRSTPSGNFESITNTVNLTLKQGDFDDATSEDPEYYDGTLKFPNLGSGSEMKDVLVLADESGEYTFNYSIHTAKRILNVVLLPSPTLEVDSVVYNDEELVKFNDAYLIIGSSSSRNLELNLKPVNIQDGYSYTINQDEVDSDDKIIIDIEEGEISVLIELPPLTIVTSGTFEEEKFFIRVYDDDDNLTGLTILYVYAQKE
jgi:hypothetical protein